MLSGQIAVEIFNAVDNGWIAFQAHFSFEAVMEDRGNQRPFSGGAGLFFDNRSQGDNRMDTEVQFVRTLLDRPG